jgi:Protein of unknown function (DUF3455)
MWMQIRLKCLALLAICAAWPAAGADDIPASLRVAAGEVVTQKLHAAGVQIYVCNPAKDGAAGFEWALKGPEAELSDQAGNKIAKHYAGPTWEARDGSKVTGETIARADSPDAHAIAWLLLSVKSVSGSGIFASVRFIQRLFTVDGKAPPEGCNAAAAGREVRVPYSAEYWFYSDKP